jgi:hypothetical protein
MISTELCDRIEDYIKRNASKALPTTLLHIAEGLHLKRTEVDECLFLLVNQGRIKGIERGNTAFYYAIVAMPAPEPVPDPMDYAEADDLADAPKPKKTLCDITDETIIKLWNEDKNQAEIAKQMHIRVDRVCYSVKRLMKQGLIQPRPSGNFRAPCGRCFTTLQGQHRHENWHGCKAPEKVEREPVTTTTDLNQNWTATWHGGMTPAPIVTKDAMTRLKEAVEELKQQGFIVYVTVRQEMC